MRNTLNPVAAALVSLVILGAAGFAPAAWAAQDKAKDAKPSVSSAAVKPLKAAQEALQAKDYAGALAHLKEAQDLPNKTEYDEFAINEMLWFADVHTNDYANAEKALEGLIASQFAAKEDAGPRMRALAQINYTLKNYDKAIQFGTQAEKEGFGNDDVYILVDQAYYLKGDYKGALDSLNGHVDNMIKNGQTPSEDRLNLILSACVKINDSECTTRALDRLVSYYPKPQYWQNVLYSMIQAPSQSDRVLLQVYRLALEVDVLKRPEDYIEMATLATAQGSPGEAERVLEVGQQKNIFADAAIKAHAAQMLASAKKQVSADTAALPKIAADAAASKTGLKDAGLGLAYLSYRQYDKATDALNSALTKGGLRSEPETRLLLGIAQLGAGKREDAAKTFDLVKGDPKLERLASLWAVHARHP